jgi:DDE superfamily endonuclease
VAAVRVSFPAATVEVWATDAHRVGLKPIVGRVWARKGQRPIVRVQHRFPWRSMLAFVHPASGQTEWQFASTVNTAVMSVALASFAAAVGAGPTKRIVLVLDQAGSHTSPLLQVPEGLHLVFLPPYSPELQPAEHLWHYTDQPLLNEHFATIDALEDAVADHCDRLQRQRDVLRSATLFHWWPAI